MTDVQLKMLLDALRSAGAEGGSLFLWWLGLSQALPSFLTSATVVLVVTLVVRAITTNMRETRQLEAETDEHRAVTRRVAQICEESFKDYGIRSVERGLERLAALAAADAAARQQSKEDAK